MARRTELVWLGGGLLAAFSLLLATRTAGATMHTVAPTEDQDWVRRVIAFVSATEGRADSLNRNLDGAGLSYGILQWNQRSGNLGVLLAAMADADPAAFASIFGPSWARMLDAARGGSLEPIDGARLWEEPWASRFVAAGRYPPFVAVQWHIAEHGEHFQGALDVARILGVRSERSLALFFDRSVQQGPGAARQSAERLRSDGLPAGYLERLRSYAALAASRFRRTTPPPSPQFSPRAPHIVWKPVGGEWHAVAGRWDLYSDVVRRASRILRAPHLADVPLNGI